MNSMISSNINGGAVLNEQVANGSRSSLLLSSVDFLPSERKSSVATSNQGHYFMKLTGKEELLNGQSRCLKENSIVTINGNNEQSAEDCIPAPKVQLYAGKIHTEWRQVYKIGAGLNNLGNTCFMNTVIQCLSYCPPLANYLLHDNDHSSKCSTTGFCMMCSFQKHLKRSNGNTGQVIKPVDIYQRLKMIAKHFQFGRQEDAHEFLRYVIDHLWKACLPPASNGLSKLDAASKETTVINKIFGGYHRSQVVCLKCKTESNTYDHFMDFILDIKQNVSSLERALEKYIQPELLQQENSYQCPKCKIKVEARKQFSVYKPPTVATFQLKRFDYNRTFGGKITKQISYPERLNLRPYMSENKGDPVWYRLNAVIVHSGPSCNSGHYYCYVKNSNSLWYIMDDQRVSQVSLNQVLHENAYVLFYIKMTDREKPPTPRSVTVRSPMFKGEVASKYFARSPEPKPSPNPPKASPLGLKNHLPDTSQSVSPPNVLRKPTNFSMPNRERVSFGFRPGLSPNAFTPRSKIPAVGKAPASSGGLVPYNKDSSDSEDDGRNIQPASKTNGKNIEHWKAKDSSSAIRDKLSEPTNPPSSLAVPKVSVSGNWIATDASDTASCSSNNSLSDWRVVAIGGRRKSSSGNCSGEPGESMPVFEPSSSQQSKNVHPVSRGQPNGINLSPKTDSYSPQNCRSTAHDNGFSQSLPKRKYIDSSSKADRDSSSSRHSENGYVPSPKKTKFTEEPPRPSNGVRNSFGRSSEGEKSRGSNYDNYRTHSVNGDLSPSKRRHSWHYGDSFKSRESPESHKDGSRGRDSSFSKDKHREKDSHYDGSSTDRRKYPLSNHVKSDGLYGAEVPTWKNENYHRSSIVPDYKRRPSFDDYDEEYDRGKVRKFKRKDNYHYFSRDNPFQNHSERNQNYSKGKYYNNHYRQSNYTHSSWKYKNTHSYHRYQNHHQRYY